MIVPPPRTFVYNITFFFSAKKTLRQLHVLSLLWGNSILP